MSFKKKTARGGYLNTNILLTVAFLVLLSKPLTSFAACTGPRTPGELRDVLWGPDSGYDKRTRPGVALQAAGNGTNPSEALPDVARVQLHVLSIRELDQKRNEYQVNVWFRQRWNDYRLAHLSVEDGGCFAEDQREGFSESDLEDLWKPDIFVENRVKVDDSVAGSFWIYPNGDLVYVKSLLITLACSMDFVRLPRDVQRFNFRVGTFLEDASDVSLDFWEDIEPMTLASDKEKETSNRAHGGSTEWKILSARGVKPEENESHGATQAESYVEFTFELGRDSDYYTDFVIFPVMLMVSIGWASFFIDRASAPARVTMSMVCFLTISNFISTQLSALPRLGTEVWLLKFLTVSQIFTFYAVIEYVICNYLCRIEKRVEGGRKKARDLMVAKSKRNETQSTLDVEDSWRDGSDESEMAPITKEDIEAAGFNYKVDLLLLKKDGNMRFKDQHLEIFSRWAYPISYVIACVVMWHT